MLLLANLDAARCALSKMDYHQTRARGLLAAKVWNLPMITDLWRYSFAHRVREDPYIISPRSELVDYRLRLPERARRRKHQARPA